MKKIIVISFVLYSVCIIAQSKIIGKTYKATIVMACKLINGGNCMIYRCCILSFEKDSVTVNYKVIPNCYPNSVTLFVYKKYGWRIHKNKFVKDNFDEYKKINKRIKI